MRFDQGLFKFDFTDHFAVLGLPLDANSAVVRKRYLQIARRLHPDSMAGVSSEDVQKASEMLSKLVNPAYETLSQEKNSSEYQIVLKLRGQTLHQSQTPIAVNTDAAKKLLKTSQLESEYRQAVNALAKDQYEQLETIESVIGQLSELNLVYLYRTADSGGSSHSTVKSTVTPVARGSTTQSETTPPPPRRMRDTILESYIKRAQDFEQGKDSGRAILELREALKAYPNSAECHSSVAALYFKSGQTTMAKIHAKRALDINPKDEQAKAVLSRLERGTGTDAKPSSAAKGKNNASSGGKGGGFFGLFGGKKK